MAEEPLRTPRPVSGAFSIGVLRDFFTYGTGEVILKMASLITVPIFTRIFAPDDYGKWTLLTAAISIFLVVISLGGESAYARCYFGSKSDRERQLLASTWIIFVSIWSLLLVLPLLPLSQKLSLLLLGTNEDALLLTLALIALPLSTVNAACGQVIRNQFQSRLFVALNIISSLCIVGGSILGAAAFNLGLPGLFAGVFAGNILILPARLWSVRTMLRPSFSWKLLREMLAFGLPLVPMSLAYWILTTSDRMILSKLASIEDVGLYSVAATIVGGIALFGSALGQAWGPHALEIYEKHPEVGQVFFGRALIYILSLFGILCVGVTTFANEILALLVPQKYHSSWTAVGPLALGAVASATCQVTALGISLSKQTKYFAYYSWVAAVLSVILCFLLIPPLGILGAALAPSISWGFLTVAYGIRSQGLVRVSYDMRQTLFVIATVIAFTLLATLIPPLPLLLSLVSKVIFVCVFVLALSLAGSFRWDELSSTIQAARIAVSNRGGESCG